jgi:hypothetical protein
MRVNPVSATIALHMNEDRPPARAPSPHPPQAWYAIRVNPASVTIAMHVRTMLDARPLGGCFGAMKRMWNSDAALPAPKKIRTEKITTVSQCASRFRYRNAGQTQKYRALKNPVA